MTFASARTKHRPTFPHVLADVIHGVDHPRVVVAKGQAMDDVRGVEVLQVFSLEIVHVLVPPGRLRITQGDVKIARDLCISERTHDF